MDSTHHGTHGPPEAYTANAHVTIAVLKNTDFDVHWFVDRQHFINPQALRLREPAVVHEAWKPVARRPNAKASSTARGSTRNELTDRNDVEAALPLVQPSDQVVSQRTYTLWQSDRRQLEAAQKEEYARQQTEKLLLVEQRLQQLTGVLHQSQVESAERAERAVPVSYGMYKSSNLFFSGNNILTSPGSPFNLHRRRSSNFIPAPNHPRIRQRTGQHPLGWQ
ncbi:hypothetical protein E4U60_001053 [Claviceps pazoutovae]|uniref:Uncharacterized protein n=1 Tax=Claviceps pazoutovae TaxID=1649127 RepID=A0A9P7MK62_9HYPO|nr:hypothetical protein E4U60_001053 [Claviceps pazoutovae]